MTSDQTIPDRQRPRTASERMQLYRVRRRRGRRVVRVEMDDADIKALVKRGFLDPRHHGHLDEIESAANAFISDALGGLCDT